MILDLNGTVSFSNGGLTAPTFTVGADETDAHCAEPAKVGFDGVTRSNGSGGGAQRKRGGKRMTERGGGTGQSTIGAITVQSLTLIENNLGNLSTTR